MSKQISLLFSEGQNKEGTVKTDSWKTQLPLKVYRFSLVQGMEASDAKELYLTFGYFSLHNSALQKTAPLCLPDKMQQCRRG